MADKGCKGLDYSEDAIKNDMVDPDYLEINAFDDAEDVYEENPNLKQIVPGESTADDFIAYYRAWYDLKDHGKPYCVGCYLLDEGSAICGMFDTDGL